MSWIEELSVVFVVLITCELSTWVFVFTLDSINWELSVVLVLVVKFVVSTVVVDVWSDTWELSLLEVDTSTPVFKKCSIRG